MVMDVINFAGLKLDTHVPEVLNSQPIPARKSVAMASNLGFYSVTMATKRIMMDVIHSA